MKVKLTLRLDRHLILQAKAYSQRTGRSVSQMVADFFSHLDSPPDTEKLEITPTVLALKEVLKGQTVDPEAYREHLEEKYL